MSTFRESQTHREKGTESGGSYLGEKMAELVKDGSFQELRPSKVGDFFLKLSCRPGGTMN